MAQNGSDSHIHTYTKTQPQTQRHSRTRAHHDLAIQRCDNINSQAKCSLHTFEKTNTRDRDDDDGYGVSLFTSANCVGAPLVGLLYLATTETVVVCGCLHATRTSSCVLCSVVACEDCVDSASAIRSSNLTISHAWFTHARICTVLYPSAFSHAARLLEPYIIEPPPPNATHSA